MKTVLLLTLFISFIAILILPVIAEENSHIYPKIIEEYNALQKKDNKKTVVMDTDICKAAVLIANDLELNYPKPVSPLVISNPRYSAYLKKYRSIYFKQRTIVDALQKISKISPNDLVASDQEEAQDIKSTIDDSPYKNQINDVCFVTSLGNLGFKPFRVVIFGIRKDLTDQFPLSIFKMLLIQIGIIKMPQPTT